jgi:hypothetical protein
MKFPTRPLILKVVLSAILVLVVLQFLACDDVFSLEATKAATGKTEASKGRAESRSKESLAAIAQRLVSKGRVRMYASKFSTGAKKKPLPAGTSCRPAIRCARE